MVGIVAAHRDDLAAPRCADCRASEQSGLIEGRSYRLVVYRSDHLDQRKAKTMERMERELKAEHKQSIEEAELVCRQRFACAADAQSAAAAWLKIHTEVRHDLTLDVEEVRERQKQTHRGRPRKDEEPVWSTNHRVNLAVGNRRQDRILHHVKSVLAAAIDRRHRALSLGGFRKPFLEILDMAGFDERIDTEVPLRESGRKCPGRRRRHAESLR